MLRKFKELWRFIAAPSLKIEALTRANEVASLGLRNATDKVAALQEKLNELHDRECPGCAILQQLVNHMTLAAGSRVKPFDAFGPSLPGDIEQGEAQEPTPLRARQFVQHQQSEFLQILENRLRETIKPEVQQ